MSINCEVVKDLLPLYHDNVCSEDSRKLIEEHLSTCLKCTEELKQINEEILTVSHTEDISLISNISKKWKRDILSAFLLGTLMLSILASIGCTAAFMAIGSYVTAEGVLVEPFALIPIAYFFAFTAILSAIGLAVTYLVKHNKKKREIKK
ncbi:DUF3955 domain-containing protein [Robinsoniella sp. RHS]|uniref:DUF3955 domain-containing protein n=1 Tax=Robinsoniella sp. RHS TaxID=1504536 RepID=UPI00064A6487